MGVFLKVMCRSLREMQDPAFAISLFEDEIRLRSESAYVQWRSTFQAWLERLGAALRLHDLDLRTDPDEDDQPGCFRPHPAQPQPREALVVGGIGNPDRYPGCRAYLLLDATENLFRYGTGEPALGFLRYGPVPWSTTVYARLD